MYIYIFIYLFKSGIGRLEQEKRLKSKGKIPCAYQGGEMSGTISATAATTPSNFKARGYSSARFNGVGSRTLQVLRASSKDEADTSTSGNMPIDGESPEIFNEIQDLLKVVDDSDVVEFEMKSDSFSLCLKKYQVVFVLLFFIVHFDGFECAISLLL